MSDYDYQNAAIEYVKDFFGITGLSAMAPRFDESATEGQDIYVKVSGPNANYDVYMNTDGEVLDCQEKL